MTTTPGDGDEVNESTYTDMQIHDSELPEDLQPENDLDAGGEGPSGDAAAADAPASGPPVEDNPSSGS